MSDNEAFADPLREAVANGAKVPPSKHWRTWKRLLEANEELKHERSRIARCLSTCAKLKKETIDLTREIERLSESLRRIANGKEDPMDIAHLALHHGG
jgi:septal ring factor EnvC (AmiA/AmiB activator)